MVTPAIGQTWRSHATSSLYRISAIDLSIPGDCIRLELVEPSQTLLAEWSATAERNKSNPGEPTTLEGVRAQATSREFWVELQWFERAATFVKEAA